MENKSSKKDRESVASNKILGIGGASKELG
jgi:hypothetical protein